MSDVSEVKYAELLTRYREASMLADKYELIAKTHQDVNHSLRETNADLRRMLLDKGEENDKLRKELEQWRRLTANIALTEYPACEFQPKDLERENDALRELVRDMLHHIEHPPCEGCLAEMSCLGDVSQCDEYVGWLKPRACELGIEVGEC